MIAGFFPPKPLSLAGQEEVANHGDVQVTHERLILADFEMRQPQLAFLVLQRAFDGPTREADVQPGFEVVFEWIPDEKPFFFFGMQGIVSPDEMVAAQDLVAATQPKGSRLDLPDHRSFFGVLDVERDPRLASHLPGVMAKFLDPACRMTRLGAGIVEPAV